MNPQAKELNELIGSLNPTVLNLLSERGKNIFFPKKQCPFCFFGFLPLLNGLFWNMHYVENVNL